MSLFICRESASHGRNILLIKEKYIHFKSSSLWQRPLCDVISNS